MWSWYYDEKGSGHVVYHSKHTPSNSVSETWTTVGLEKDGAKITFCEYKYYDLDPDGVREAFDCTYDSEYTLTANVSEYDPEKLFVYLLKNGVVERSMGEPDVDNTQAIFIFTEPTSIDNSVVAEVTALDNGVSFDAVREIMSKVTNGTFVVFIKR